MRVLVVEDHDDIRLLASMVLGVEGHEVDEASDGAVALEMVRRSAYDLVLLDIRIPTLDGLELLGIIRDEGVPALVIVFSAHADAGTEQAALQRGADAFVVKPFTSATLLEAIARVRAVER